MNRVTTKQLQIFENVRARPGYMVRASHIRRDTKISSITIRNTLELFGKIGVFEVRLSETGKVTGARMKDLVAIEEIADKVEKAVKEELPEDKLLQLDSLLTPEQLRQSGGSVVKVYANQTNSGEQQ